MTDSFEAQPAILSQRASGILLHPSSLPGPYGMGDLGEAAYQFVDVVADCHQQLWQILPLGPLGAGNSPYASYSAMAGNPLLISLDRLQQEGWLAQEDLEQLPQFPRDRVDYDKVVPMKRALLQQAADAFKAQANSEQRQQFEQFCDAKSAWLEDYALFTALKRDRNGAPWYDWEPELVQRQPDALDQFRKKLADDIFREKFLQFEFFRQWTELRQYANDHGIFMIGDIPIYVAHDSVDVWTDPENFCLNPQTHQPALMAGTPPDFFSETGQLWGNPVYNWDHLKSTGFAWWVQRFEALLDYVDLVRVDHFIGLSAFWAVPEGKTDARAGQWIDAPGEQLLKTLRQKLGQLPILAEDLGTVSHDVERLRDTFGLPGMKILQFAFKTDAKNPYLPFHYPTHCIVYPGTHDNATAVGWFESLSSTERAKVLTYLGGISSEGIHWDLIRLAFSSVAHWAIVPLQDILGLGNEARMNNPATGAEGNWEWRYQPEALTPELCDRLRQWTDFFDRAPKSDHSDHSAHA